MPFCCCWWVSRTHEARPPNVSLFSFISVESIWWPIHRALAVFSYLFFRKKGRPPTGRHPAVLLIAEPTIPWPFHLTKKKYFAQFLFFFFTARANRLGIFSFTSFVRKIVRNQYYKTGEVARQLSPAVDEPAFRFPWPVLLLSFPSRILFSALLAWNLASAAEKRWCGHWPRERDGRPDGKGEREIQMNGPSCPVIGRTTRCFVFACPATFSVQKVFWHFFFQFWRESCFFRTMVGHPNWSDQKFAQLNFHFLRILSPGRFARSLSLSVVGRLITSLFCWY